MNIVYKYKVVFAVVLPILILVLIRSFGTNHFRSDTGKWAEPSVMQSNILTTEQFKALAGEKMLISLGVSPVTYSDLFRTALSIPYDSILSNPYFKIIRKHAGPVVLFSADQATAARIWMVLSQMGLRNIFILSSNNGNEVLKYKFRSDTLVRPESSTL
jgi:hypothetical protein